MSGLDDEYLALLTRLGQVAFVLRAESGEDAVLVGGAAVAFYTDGHYATGDFDVFFQDAARFAAAMARFGFVREAGSGRFLNAWYLPECPHYGVQLVGGQLFDGLSDRRRMRVIQLSASSQVTLPAIEDLIADRIGQYCSLPDNPDESSLEQARLLLKLADRVDWTYLRSRIEDEQGDISLLS
jgi:hypothetical protein